MGRITENLKILGVDCVTCVYSIQRSLHNLKGFIELKADVTSGMAVVTYDNSLTTLKQIVDAIRKAGYDVESEEIVLELNEEVYLIEPQISKVIGVIEVRPLPHRNVARVVYNPHTVSRDRLLRQLSDIGFKLREVTGAVAVARERRSKELLVRLASFTLGLTAISYHSSEVLLGLAIPTRDYVLLTIASAVIVLCRDVLVRGLKSLVARSPTTDSLIALSASVTYAFSLAVMMSDRPSGTYFEASAGVLGFVSLGKYLESRLRARALRRLRELGELQARRARVFRDGGLVEVDPAEVRVGEVVEVRAGERIPVDGVVVDGWGYVDESTFTGEPIPRFKSADGRDPVLAGTLLTGGYLRIRATRVGKNMTLSHVIEAIGEAQLSKPSIQMAADRAVGYLTWSVVALALATFAYWSVVEGRLDLAVVFTASVFAVACPCPLGIAVPMVVSIAVIRASQLGILVRSGELFERLLQVNTVLFDKTGTLTEGSPRVGLVRVFSGFSEAEVLKLACSVEGKSEHVLAEALVAYCRERGIDSADVQDFEHVPGMGVLGRVDGRDVAVGSRKLMEGLGVGVNADAELLAAELSYSGYTVVFVAVDRRLAAIVGVGDKPRDGVREVVDFLKGIGMRLAVATGDSEAAGRALAREIGIDEVYAWLTPVDKAELVEEMQRKGLRVMFVGDGVNDAIALSRAFVGIAVDSGADVSKEAGDAVVFGNKIASLPSIYKLSRDVRRKGLENLLWAFIYNAILVPVAMGLLYKPFGLVMRPELAATAMILSDLSVILNSLTLLRQS